MTSAAELERQGWTRRNVACEPRLGEAAELYRSLGLEVRLVPLGQLDRGEGEASCAACFEDDPLRHQVIFTRPLERRGREGDVI